MRTAGGYPKYPIPAPAARRRLEVLESRVGKLEAQLARAPTPELWAERDGWAEERDALRAAFETFNVTMGGAKWGAGTPHRHTEFLLSDNEFRCVPIRGKVLAQVPPDLIHFRLEKFTDDGAQWMLSLTVNHPDGPCRCRWWDAPPKERK